MGDLRRDPVAALQREVWPPQSAERRPAGMLGLLAAALLMAVGIDTALWHQNLERREMERRAHSWEVRASELGSEVQNLRDQLAASQQHARALHDELALSGPTRACTQQSTPEVTR